MKSRELVFQYVFVGRRKGVLVALEWDLRIVCNAEKGRGVVDGRHLPEEQQRGLVTESREIEEERLGHTL